jgi:hypothetical protein
VRTFSSYYFESSLLENFDKLLRIYRLNPKLNKSFHFLYTDHSLLEDFYFFFVT